MSNYLKKLEEIKAKAYGTQGTSNSSNNSGSTTVSGNSQAVLDRIKSRANDTYYGDMDAKSVESWFTNTASTIKGYYDYSTANNGKWVSDYGSGYTDSITKLRREGKAIGAYLSDHKNEFSDYESLSKAFSEYISYLDEAEKHSNSMRGYYGQFANEREYNTWYEKESKRNEFESASSSEDFGQYSQIGANIENPEFDDARIDKYNLWDSLFKDKINNPVTFGRNNAESLKEKVGNASSSYDVGTVNEYYMYNEMTEDEVAIYNYYLGKGDTKKAEEYLKLLEETLNERAAGKIATRIDNTALEAVFAFGAGIDQAATGLKNVVNMIKGTEGEATTTTQYAYSQMSANNTGAWKVVNDLSQTTGNMLPSILVGSFTGGLGGALTMGASSSGNAYSEMRKLGYDEWQSRGYGALVGASEAALSYALSGISKLGGKVSNKALSKLISKIDNAFARTAITLGGKMASEGLEEAIQTVLEPAFKALVTGEEFEGAEWDEILYSALLGALSAGVLEGAPTIAGTVHSNYKTNVQMGGLSNKGAVSTFFKGNENGNKGFKGVAESYKAGKQAVTESAGAYVNEALEIDSNNAHAQRMQARLDKGKNVSGYQINRLVEANENALVSQDKDKIKSAVEARLTELGESGDISTLADVIVKAQTGESLTSSERNILVNSKYGRRVSTELNPQSIESGEYATKWAENIGTERINTEQYNRGLAEASESIAEPTKANTLTKNATLKENATEAKFTTPVEAKATIERDGKSVEVKIDKIESINNDGMSLKLEGGVVVNAADVNIDGDLGLVYQAASDMASRVGGFNVDTANTFVKGYSTSLGITAGEYVHGWTSAYKFGTQNSPASILATNPITAKLTDEQRTTAYNFGRAFGKDAVENNSTKIVNTVSKNSENISKSASKLKKGRVVFDGSTVGKSLNERQRASLKALRFIAEAMGIDIHIFESPLVNGKRVGENGSYDPDTRTIRIDLYAGANGDSLMLFTAAHELTHHIREVAPTKYKLFADALLEEFTKNGVSLEELIQKKLDILEKKGRLDGKTEEQAYDLAYEEVVADACEAMLVDSNAFEALSRKIHEKDKGLWQTIKDFIAKLVARIKAAYKGLNPDSIEANKVRGMVFSAEKLQKLWVDALLEASNASTTEKLADAGIGFDSETKSVYSIRYSPARKDADGNVVDVVTVGKKNFNIESIAKLVSEATGRSIEDARRWVNSEVTIANIVMNNPEFLDFEADNRYESIKKNSDYPQGTVDLSNLCPKRTEFTSMFDMLQKKYPNRLFTASDVAAMRGILKEQGITVACGACFVEDRRQLLGEIADTYIGMWKEAVETGKPLQKTNAAGNKITLKVTAALAKQYGLKKGADILATDTYIPTQYDLTTYEGFKLLEKNHPTIAMGFNRYNNSRGQQAGRLIEGRAEYNRQILGWTDAKVRSVNNNGGLRIFSFSDFEVVHLLDLVQVIIDCAARGVKIQGYTKIPAFARLVRDTGIKINRSLIPKGQTGIKMVNGKQVLDIDTVEGIDIEDENFLDEKDNPNVGNIIIGINPTQIGIAMLDDFIDYIIPFHTNKAKDICKKLGIGEWVNYKESQHEKDISTGKGSKHNVNIYTQVINKYHPTNKVEFVNAFLKECRAQKKIPRYSEFLNKEYKEGGAYSDEYGAFDYTYREGYHKLLVDFKMFDKAGNILPQGNITPELDNKFMTELLKAEVKKKQNYEFPKEVYDRLDREFGVKHSDRDSSYMDAVNRGDMVTAQRMVAEAAREAGYTSPKLYHGTNLFGYTKFEGTEGHSYDEIQYFATESMETANTYSGTNKVRRVSEEYELDYDIEDEYEEQAREIADDLAAFMSSEIGYYNYIDGDYILEAIKDGDEIKMDDIESRWLFDIYHSEYTEEYEEFYEFEESEACEKLVNKFDNYFGQIKSIYKALDKYETSGIYEFYANTENLFVIDGKGKHWNALEDSRLPDRILNNGGKGIKLKYKTRDVCAWAKKQGYAGVLFKNIIDSGSGQDVSPSNVYAFFDPRTQVKSADPVTYDADGNVIPLSERFNSKNNDIRYSERASNKDLAEMDDTALYIKNTDKANYIGMIFNGAKTEETRSQRTLDAFIGKDFYVTDGKLVYGSIVLGEPHKYTEADFHEKKNQLKHRVPKGDKYDIKPGGIKWAYPIESYNKFDKPKKLSDSKEYKNSFQARQVMYSDRDSTAKKPRSAQAQRDEGYMLSESKFYQLYSAHKLTYGNRGGEIHSVIEKIKRDGFISTTSNSNVLPTGTMRYIHYDRDGKVKYDNIVQARYAPKKGDYVLFVPNNYVTKDDIIKNGFKPFDHEIGVVEYDNQPYYEVYQKAYRDHNKDTSKYSDRDNIGYHAGDLGKAEFLHQQGYSRDTGHFGTGTYFVGEEARISGDSNYGNRPHHAVDFSDYNLYKVSDTNDGYKLHEHLRVIDGGISQEWLDAAENHQVMLVSMVDAYDLAEERFGDDKYSNEAMESAILELAEKHGIELLSREEYSKKNRIPLDDEGFDLYYVDDYLKRAFKDECKKINSDFAKFKDAHFDFKFRFGFKATKQALEKVIEYQNTNANTRFYRDKKDSLATVFMKALGYEGVDVRGTRLDNTMYGSVIYDLKEDSILYSDREIQPITDEEYKTLKKHFGTTGNFKVAGYLLPDGNLLDFSGKHWGDTTSRSRQVDHRDVSEVLERGNNGINDMVDMIGSGAIRLMPEIGGINLAVYPTEKQRRVLSLYIRQMLATEEQVIIDYDSVGGDTVHSRVYEKYASSTQILSDIRNYFNGARQSDLMRFRTEFSDRDTDSFSNRSLLANALETAAQNDIERNKLKEYKAKIDLINAEEQKLQGLRKQIKELSFRPGTRDTKAIKSLQFEANQTANRINTYDRQLLNLESTKALKGVLEREKKLAYQKAEKQGKEALARYKERAANTQRELMNRYQESRKKASEGRNRTAMRHKIKGVVSDLNKLLNRGTKDRHVKEGLKETVASSLALAEMLFSDEITNADIVRLNKDSETFAEYSKLLDKIEELQEKRELVAGTEKVSEQLLAKVGSVEEEIAKARNRISTLNSKLSEVFKLERERLNNATASQLMESLAKEYLKLKDSDIDYIRAAYEDYIYTRLDSLKDSIGGTIAKDMSLEQLAEVYDAYTMIRNFVRDANKTFKGNKSETAMQRAEAVADQVRTVAGQPYKHNAIKVGLMKAGWKLLKPYVAFRTIGSVTLTNLYKELRNGEDTFYNDVADAQAFIEKQYEKHGYKDWDFKKTKTFTAKSGKTFDLNLEQMMTLYAYYQREKSHKHIMEGGIVFEDSLITEKNKLGVPISYQVTTKDAFNLSEETFKGVCDYLEKNHKDVVAYVKEMQEYLSKVMGEKGNEVSMELLGVKLFKEEFYLPIKSSNFYMNFNPQEAGEVMLKNPGFSKETTPGANNPIVLHNFTDLWCEHVNDMSMYHSFVLALEDFTRVYNYKTRTDSKVETMGTKGVLETAYPGVNDYITKFLRDMNGGVRGETVGWAEKMTSLAKKGSVLGSWSVTIQQPSAIMRAMAVIKPIHFVATAHKSLNLVKHKADWAELKKYAPIAGIKEMGRFDVGMGQATKDWIQSNKTLMEKGEDILSAAPAFMDEVTWVSIWNAVKRETLHNNKNLSPTSEEFLKIAGERFTEVISLTQVYDSVFSRSDLMRNKSWIAKTLTAFMAEPTTTLNMIWDSLVQGKRTGSAKGFIRTTATTGGAIVSAIVLNAALKSIVMAMRDDDEDESYAEKYLENFFGDLKDNLNPLTLIPFVKDIVSIYEGYDVERMDMALISDLKNAMEAFDSDSKTTYEKWSGLIGAISAIFGVPVKNVERDIRGLINTFFGETEDTTVSGILNAIEEGWSGEDKSNGQQLYEAMLKGDAEQIERVKGRFKDQSAINTAIRKALRENDPRIKEAAELRYNGDISGYMKIAKEIIREGIFKQDDVVAAINSEINEIKKRNGETETSTPSNKVVSLYTIEDYYVALSGRDDATAYAVKYDIIETEVANGKSRDEAEKSFNSKFVSHIRELYEANDINDYKAKDMLINYGGKSADEAASKVQYWDFKKQYPDYDLTEEAVKKYYSEVKPSGISVAVYYDYTKLRSQAKGTDLNGDGKTDSGSVKAEVLRIINSLPISSYQKDTLYYLNGWSQSTINEAPWR